MMDLLQLVCDPWVHVFVPMGFVFGCYLDKRDDEKLTALRNESMLFQREPRSN
ncbi:NADH dehydrogenase [ubiquinone] 1 beta subcomplex subunit 1-like [Psammomys obesus]|uniref:NADH dehydrogenase [ubiquinone] 1 beta subcomplex subunit 1-like n=1 Tax=Psammomys obesus TaxID=48139 RepID=UPI002452A301|nr:NADH dehydrogenase [ubiquinone] 1 beta subcomplex subunit 1-like [Psammomys obesus]